MIVHKSNFFRIDTNLIWYARWACKSISERHLIQSLSRKSRCTLWWHRKLYSMHFHSCKTTKNYFLYWSIIKLIEKKTFHSETVISICSYHFKISNKIKYKLMFTEKTCDILKLAWCGKFAYHLSLLETLHTLNHLILFFAIWCCYFFCFANLASSRASN